MVTSPGLSQSDLVRHWSVRFSAIMVFSGCALMVLMVTQVFFGGSSGLVPQIGRSSLSQDVLHAFELRLLSMFGLKHRPSPSRSAVVPQYMMDLYSMHSVTRSRTTATDLKARKDLPAARIRSGASTMMVSKCLLLVFSLSAFSKFLLFFLICCILRAWQELRLSTDCSMRKWQLFIQSLMFRAQFL